MFAPVPSLLQASPLDQYTVANLYCGIRDKQAVLWPRARIVVGVQAQKSIYYFSRIMTG